MSTGLVIPLVDAAELGLTTASGRPRDKRLALRRRVAGETDG